MDKANADLNQMLLVENLKKDLNIGLIPKLEPAAQFVEQPVAINSYFAIGHFLSEGHVLDYQIHIMMMNRPNIPKVVNYNISITDETTGWFYSDDKIYMRDECEVEVIGEEENAKQVIKVPNGCMIGNCNELHWEGVMPHGRIEMDMVGYGYTVFNGGSGNFNSCGKGQPFSQYSIPNMKTTGTLTLDDKTYSVTGKTWVDRQWQAEEEETDLLTAKWNWTWMDLNLDNGDVISLWDMCNFTRNFNSAWATVMHPDGTQCTCCMDLLKENAFDFWYSPESEQYYPTRWMIKIPDLDAELEVTSVIKESEIVSDLPFLNKYEGAATVKGTYKREPMTGHCYVEMLGSWTK